MKLEIYRMEIYTKEHIIPESLIQTVVINDQSRAASFQYLH